jgi:uncharacterized membrane protein YagU involved in acid resistance
MFYNKYRINKMKLIKSCPGDDPEASSEKTLLITDSIVLFISIFLFAGMIFVLVKVYSIIKLKNKILIGMLFVMCLEMVSIIAWRIIQVVLDVYYI